MIVLPKTYRHEVLPPLQQLACENPDLKESLLEAVREIDALIAKESLTLYIHQKTLEILGRFQGMEVARLRGVLSELVSGDIQPGIQLLWLRQFLQPLHKEVQRHNIKSEFQCDRGVRVAANPVAFDIVWNNLIRNAIQHGKSERPLQINIYGYQEEGMAAIEFTDNGKELGKDCEYCDRVFEEGWSTSGGGVGLYLCKQIIDAHGGEIYCIPRSSKESRGMQFKILMREKSLR